MDAVMYLTSGISYWYHNDTYYPDAIAKYLASKRGIPENDPLIVESVNEFQSALRTVIGRLIEELGGEPGILWQSFDVLPSDGEKIEIRGVCTYAPDEPNKIRGIVPTKWRRV